MTEPQKRKLILVPSESMDANKKKDRKEKNLVRMSAAARKHMGFGGDSVEVWKTGGKAPMMLTIFKAYAEDIKNLKATGNYSEDELKRVAFVSSHIYKDITGKNTGIAKSNIWISKNTEDLMYGADPEFLLFDTKGAVVRANNVLNHQGKMGCDGAMAEIRPEPSKDITQLVKNMRKIFKSTDYDGVRKYDWLACCYHKDAVRDYPVGGHIHMGNTKQINNHENKLYFFLSLNKVLDELLAVPMIKLDGTDDGYCRRSKCQMSNPGHDGFGHFGEMRLHAGRLEHRTLSGIWLMHPSIARAVLGTAKAIIDEAHHIAKNEAYRLNYVFNEDYTGSVSKQHPEKSAVWSKDFQGWGKIPMVKEMGCKYSAEKMVQLLNESKVSSVTYTYLKSWRGRLRNMSTYKANSEWIEGLFEILTIPTKELNTYGREIKENWLEDKTFIVDV